MGIDGGGMEVKRLFIGAGCNRIVNNASWGACDLLSFGAQNAVAIFCPETAQILTTLPGHSAYVNCTQWLPSSKFAFKAKNLERHYLLSGDADGTIFLWEYSLADRSGGMCYKYQKSIRKVLHALLQLCCLIQMLYLHHPVLMCGECKLSCLDSIFVGKKPMVALSLVELPGGSRHLALAMGGLDNKIHIYSGERAGKFVRACELKGHTDWIRSLDFSLPLYGSSETPSLLLVSSSQDKGIRIWKMALHESIGNNRKEETSLASYIKGPIFSAGPSSYQVSLESLLVGHEDWVYSVEWQPPQSSSIYGIECYQPQSILSASMDKTMMIWQPEKTTGIWMNMVTVGELSHCALGFYGGHWSPSGNSILAHGYGGSFHLWKNVGTDFDDWKPQKVPSGHFASVSDISWAREGEYLLSVSHDQKIERLGMKLHDLKYMAMILIVWQLSEERGTTDLLKSILANDLPVNVQILGANMSALGLSQKPIYVQASPESKERNNNEGIDTLETIPEAMPVELTKPPIEEQLAWHTLWPESHKLYGHGNELFSVCSDHEGKLVASSCKAQSASVAEIWLWEVGSWKAVGRLHSHSLTVTQLEFSHDNSFLLSVSRDRHFSIFAIKQTGGADEISHQLVIRQEAHKRIIWTCSWNPFGHEFATGSRDKTVKIWELENGSSVKLLMTLPMFKSSITALSWLGVDRQKNHGLLAVGMESGLVELWSLSNTKTDNSSISAPNAALFIRLDPFMCHISAVHQLRWKNSTKSEDSTSMQLASCGADHCVRIFQVDV
ncbi:UNVERIFIED_CONTAM: Elongator complex protein 2 [Sesamum calycinum]|uniref:Elongator complex protein 2 n=1 Tax=Sesamum calycinum TaxID=2727403 RepID=A0AAW2QYW8_9LAMI